MSSDPFSSRSCRVALLGFGTAGSSVARRLAAADAPVAIQLIQIVDRRASSRPPGVPHTDLAWTERVDDVRQGDFVLLTADFEPLEVPC